MEGEGKQAADQTAGTRERARGGRAAAAQSCGLVCTCSCTCAAGSTYSRTEPHSTAPNPLQYCPQPHLDEQGVGVLLRNLLQLGEHAAAGATRGLQVVNHLAGEGRGAGRVRAGEALLWAAAGLGHRVLCAAHNAGRARHAARAAIHGCWGNQGTASGCCYEGGAPRQQALTTSWLGAAFTMAALYSAFVHADTRLGGAPAASFHQLFSASRAARACACSSSFLQGGAVRGADW